MGVATFGRRLAHVDYQDRPGAYAFLRDDGGHALAVVETPSGLFLPGGGLDPGESPEIGLARELREEIGYELITSEFVVTAEQFHRSDFYQAYFRKIGSFYRVTARAPAVETLQAEHKLIWMSKADAERRLSQEFQRWAAQFA